MKRSCTPFNAVPPASASASACSAFILRKAVAKSVSLPF